MSYNTIVRSFNNEDLYKAAQMHNFKTIYTLKYIIYTFITFFACQNIIKLRDLRRQQEICNVANNILATLPKSYNELDNDEYILHTNVNQKYQIKCIAKQLYLSRLNNSNNDDIVMIADINNEDKFNNIKNKLNIIEFQKKYDDLSSIKLYGLSLIDNLPQLRIYSYQKYNDINELIKYFNYIYSNQTNYKEPWREKNISLDQYAKKFKDKFDYFIKHRYEKKYNSHNNPIAGDDIYELTRYFLYHNPKIREQLININFGDPIIVDGIINLINLDEGIKISNIQALHTNLLDLNNNA
jgi:hypothetical protein